MRKQMLRRSADIFIKAGEKFIVSCKVEKPGPVGSLMGRIAPDTVYHSKRGAVLTPQVLLHKDATPFDVFRSLVAVNLLMHSFKHTPEHSEEFSTDVLVDMVRRAYREEQADFKQLVSQLRTQGWDLSRFMFGSIETRVEW
jgi:hypothetical protein